MFNLTDKERSPAAPGDERSTPTSDNAGPIIPPIAFPPNRVPSAGEAASGLILLPLTLLALLLLLYLALRFRQRQIPSYLVAAFDRAFLPEVYDGR